ncbi:unnamed protein product [Phytophthora fragariaefolia]|uniref:Unnamed protein product n=1 Tax=Phytophthora fragariaefolia TaxID=1490495 RepID=A0A9W6TV26_9STRA|nr:unnamed protein product [Phytophthora fragariaefolia]
MGWAFLVGEKGWLNQRGEMPMHAGTILRLKMLYHLVCAPEMSIVVPSEQHVVDIQDTEKRLDDLIKTKISLDKNSKHEKQKL